MTEEAIQEITQIIEKYEEDLPAMCGVLYCLKGAMLVGCENIILEHTTKASHELLALIQKVKASVN